MRSRYYTATFMLYLVLSLVLILPVQAADVTITGKEGIAGIRETQDTTSISITAQGNVSIVKDGQAYPMTCELVSEIYTCAHEFPTSTLQPGEYTLNFKQHDPDEDFSEKFIVDGEAPQVERFDVKAVGTQLNISYEVSDTAFLGNAELCAGIASVSVTTDSDTIYEKTYDQRNCFEKNNILISPEGLHGEQQFYLAVYDAFGLRNESTPINLSVDFNAPEIQDGVDVFIDNRTVSVIAAQPYFVPLVDVQIIVIDENLTSVRGDLTALVRDPTKQAMYQNYAATCVEQGPQHICTFPNVPLNPGVAIPSIIVTATDQKGNQAIKTLQAQFSLQSEAGKVTYFGPEEDRCYLGDCYITRGVNKIQVSVQDAGVGIKPYLITLAVGDLGVLETTKTTSCNMSTDAGYDIYDCYAHVPTAPLDSGVTRTITLTQPSVDMMGTPLQGKTTVKVIVDQDAPELLTNITASTSCPVAGETATYSINISEFTSPLVRIKTTTEYVTESAEFVNDCVQEGSYFACELELYGFVSYPEEEDIIITVEDLAGTTAEISYTITVCEANNQIEPEFIRDIKTSTNQFVDKRVATFMPVKVYLPLEFVMKNSAAEIIDMQADCGATKDLGGNAYIINKNSKQPTLVVPIGGRQTLLPDEIGINCTLDVYQTRGTIRYTQPEQQPFYYEVAARGQELGTISETTQEKLEKIQEQLRDLDEKIDKRMKYHNVLNTICNIANTITRLSQIAATIKALGILVGTVAEVWGAGDAVWSAFSTIADFLDVSRIFQFPSGQLSKGAEINNKEGLKLGVSTIVKLGCLIYNCGLCSAGGIIEAANLFETAVDGFRAPSVEEQAQADSAASEDATENEEETETNEATDEDLSRKEKRELRRQERQEERLSEHQQRIEVQIASDATIKEITDKANDMREGIQNLEIEIQEQKQLIADGAVLNPTLPFQPEQSIVAVPQEELPQNDDIRLKTPSGETDFIPQDVLNEKRRSYDGKQLEMMETQLAATKTKLDQEELKLTDRENAIAKSYWDSDQHISSLDSRSTFYDLNWIRGEGEPVIIDYSMKKEDLIDNMRFAELDPYKSVHLSEKCVCNSGVIYNYNKHKQLLCRYYKCLSNAAEQGLPPALCDLDYDQGKCVYVDSALFNQHNSWAEIYGMIFLKAMKGETEKGEDPAAGDVAMDIFSGSRKILCFDEYLPFGIGTHLLNKLKETSLKVDGWRSTYCTTSGAVMTLLNVRALFNKPWAGAPLEPESEINYCEGLTWEEVET